MTRRLARKHARKAFRGRPLVGVAYDVVPIEHAARLVTGLAPSTRTRGPRRARGFGPPSAADRDGDGPRRRPACTQ